RRRASRGWTPSGTTPRSPSDDRRLARPSGGSRSPGRTASGRSVDGRSGTDRPPKEVAGRSGPFRSASSAPLAPGAAVVPPVATGRRKSSDPPQEVAQALPFLLAPLLAPPSLDAAERPPCVPVPSPLQWRR